MTQTLPRGSRSQRPATTGSEGRRDVAAEPVDYGDDLELPEIGSLSTTPVHTLWAYLMRDVRSIARQSDLPVQGKTTVKFRGINEVIAACTNAVRKYGLIIAPSAIASEFNDTHTSRGTLMRECVATVTYSLIGPAGDVLPVPLTGLGQAADTGDRAATKAIRVAYRNMMLDLLLANTGAPDPETEEFERGVPQVTPEDYRREILDGRTTAERLRQIRKEFADVGRLDYMTTDGYDQPATFRALIDYVGKARKEGRDPYPPRVEPGESEPEEG